jgi:hypothetical protein
MVSRITSLPVVCTIGIRYESSIQLNRVCINHQNVCTVYVFKVLSDPPLNPRNVACSRLPGMGNQTLDSLSQYCAGGTSGVQNVGVFTKSGFRMFSLNSALPALKLLSENGHEVTRGTVKESIYVQESA